MIVCGSRAHDATLSLDGKGCSSSQGKESLFGVRSTVCHMTSGVHCGVAQLVGRQTGSGDSIWGPYRSRLHGLSSEVGGLSDKRIDSQTSLFFL